jgi:hypothetical protein
MNRNGALKVAGIVGGLVVGTLTTLQLVGWAPWHMVQKAEAKVQHKSLETQSLQRHDALLQRIQANEKIRDEAHKRYEKIDRRLWQILNEVRK